MTVAVFGCFAMNTSPEGSIAATVPGWIAGLLATMAESGMLFDQVPMLGFVLVGGIGGFAGWALAIEMGKLDTFTTRQHVNFLIRRILLGMVIGVAIGSLWLDEPTSARGLWMLGTGIAAAAPVEITRAVIDAIVRLISTWVPKGKQ